MKSSFGEMYCFTNPKHVEEETIAENMRTIAELEHIAASCEALAQKLSSKNKLKVDIVSYVQSVHDAGIRHSVQNDRRINLQQQEAGAKEHVIPSIEHKETVSTTSNIKEEHVSSCTLDRTSYSADSHSINEEASAANSRSQMEKEKCILSKAAPTPTKLGEKLETSTMSCSDKYQEQNQVDYIESDIEVGKIRFEDLWRAMDLALDGSWESNIKQQTMKRKELDAAEWNICSHNYLLKYNVGMVCENCGRISKSIDNIYEFAWRPKVQRRKLQKCLGSTTPLLQSGKLESVLDLGTNLAVGFPTLHPFLEQKMNPHQKEGFKFLWKNLIGDRRIKVGSLGPGGCILAHAPGTGKTLIIVAFIQSFLTKFPDGRPMIVAPTIMLNSWQREFKRWEVEELPLYNLNEESHLVSHHIDVETSSLDVNYLAGNLKQALTPNRLKTIQDWYDSKGVLIISYKLFSGLVSKDDSKNEFSTSNRLRSLLLYGPGLVVLDEGHFPRTERTKVLNSLLLLRTQRRVLLSGTLFQNNFKEFFNLLNLCRPHFMRKHLEQVDTLDSQCTGMKYAIRQGFEEGGEREQVSSLDAMPKVGHTKFSEKNLFMEEFGEKIMHIGENKTTSFLKEEKLAIQSLRSLTSPFIHWYSGKILESLPGMKDFVAMLNLTGMQQDALQKLEREKAGMSYLEQENRVSAGCIHPVLLCSETTSQLLTQNADTKVLDPMEGVKTTFVFDLLEFCRISEERIIIFSQKLSPLDLIENMLERVWSWKRGCEILRLDGSTSQDQRQEVIDCFNHQGNKVFILLASLYCCKEGISLVGGSRIVVLDVVWNPSVVRQAISRAFRIGQQRMVYVYRLVAAQTREVTILNTSIKKEWLSRVVSDPSIYDVSEHYRGLTACSAGLIQVVDQKHGDKFLDEVMVKRKNSIEGIYEYDA